jgi:hypothetical protein
MKKLSKSCKCGSRFWERPIVWCYAVLLQLPFKYAYSFFEEDNLPLPLLVKTLRLRKLCFKLETFRLKWVFRFCTCHVLYLSFLVWLKFGFYSERQN